MAKKKKPQLVSEPSLGDVLLIHTPFDNWFLRQTYIAEDGERRARLIREDQKRDSLYKAGLSQAKTQKGRLLQLIKSEITGNKEINTWEVIADYLDEE